MFFLDVTTAAAQMGEPEQSDKIKKVLVLREQILYDFNTFRPSNFCTWS